MSANAEASHDHHEVNHDYHILEPSKWPFVGSMAAFFLTLGAVFYMHGSTLGFVVMLLGLAGVLYTMWGWWSDVLAESAAGDHKPVVAHGLRMGMALFITSEVAFFVAFFWAFFWGPFNLPEVFGDGWDMNIAAYWPPNELKLVPAGDIPLMNTLILLLSGTTVTWAHHAVREGDNATATKALILTVVFGAIFTSFQIYEYIHAAHLGLTIDDGMFGASFYMATGFHGFHVFVGTIFLAVCAIRASQNRLDKDKHVGFEAAAWYWHFVDVVWLFLFVWVYIWGGVYKAQSSALL